MSQVHSVNRLGDVNEIAPRDAPFGRLRGAQARRAQFSEQEIASLTLAIAMINTWNRLNVAFRTPAGGYKPGMFKNLSE